MEMTRRNYRARRVFAELHCMEKAFRGSTRPDTSSRTDPISTEKKTKTSRLETRDISEAQLIPCFQGTIIKDIGALGHCGGEHVLSRQLRAFPRSGETPGQNPDAQSRLVPRLPHVGKPI